VPSPSLKRPILDRLVNDNKTQPSEWLKIPYQTYIQAQGYRLHSDDESRKSDLTIGQCHQKIKE